MDYGTGAGASLTTGAAAGTLAATGAGGMPILWAILAVIMLGAGVTALIIKRHRDRRDLLISGSAE